MRKAPAVLLHWEQRRQLLALIHGPATPARAATRGRAILRAADGATNLTIAREVGTHPATVASWRRRFLAHGVPGLLRDAPRSGRPPRIAPSTLRTILQYSLARPPGVEHRWTTRSLAMATGVSKSTIQRVWRAHGIPRTPSVAPPRAREAASMDFLERVTDLVGLFLNPPERAVAFSTDDRIRPNPFRTSGEPAGLPERKRDPGAEFRAFLQMTDRETPRILDVHLLVDSRVSPLPEEVERWLAHHPRFHLHFLPPDRTGGTLIDRLIEGFSRRKDRPGASASAHRLKYALQEHMVRDRGSARAFVWTATSGDIRGAYGRRSIQQ